MSELISNNGPESFSIYLTRFLFVRGSNSDLLRYQVFGLSHIIEGCIRYLFTVILFCTVLTRLNTSVCIVYPASIFSSAC
jgi:hypothetical protein